MSEFLPALICVRGIHVVNVCVECIYDDGCIVDVSHVDCDCDYYCVGKARLDPGANLVNDMYRGPTRYDDYVIRECVPRSWLGLPRVTRPEHNGSLISRPLTRGP